MTGLVTISGRTIPEAWLWAVSGGIGFLLGIPGYPLVLSFAASGWNPNLAATTVGYLAALLAATWLARTIARPAAVRAWAAVAWCLVTGWAYFVVLSAMPALPMDGPAV